jgi:uncharacterized protein YndB with AHSA1/START domain
MTEPQEDEASCDFLDRHTVCFVREMPHSVERVWSAITNPEEIDRWFVGPARLDLRLGGDYRFGLHFAGTIRAYDPPRLIEFGEWRFQLDPTDIGCRLTFTAWVPSGFTFEGADPNEPGGDQPFGPGTWYPGTLAGWHLMLRDLRRTLDDGLNYGFGTGPSDRPSNAAADAADRTAALMAAYWDIERASPVLATSAREDPVDPAPGPPILLRAVAGKTDVEIERFADEFGGYRNLCFTVLEGFASQVAPFRIAPKDLLCSVGFDLGNVGAWSMSIADGICRLDAGITGARATVRISPPDFLRLVSGAVSLDEALTSGQAAVEGSPDEVHRLVDRAASRLGPYLRRTE